MPQIGIKEAQLQNHDLVLAQSEKYVKVMAGIYREAERDVIQQLNYWYNKYLTTKNPEDYYNIAIQYNRLNELLDGLHKQYGVYLGRINSTINESLEGTFKEAYYRQSYLFDWISPNGINLQFTRLDDNLTRLFVTGNFKQFGNIQQRLIDRYGDLSRYTPPYGSLSDILTRNSEAQLIELNQIITKSLINGDRVDQLTDAMKVSYMGILLSESQYNDMVTWMNKEYPVTLTDDLGQGCHSCTGQHCSGHHDQ